MLVECLKFIGSWFPVDTKKDVFTRGSFVVATSATIQGSYVLDTVILMFPTLQLLQNSERISASLSICFLDTRDL